MHHDNDSYHREAAHDSVRERYAGESGVFDDEREQDHLDANGDLDGTELYGAPDMAHEQHGGAAGSFRAEGCNLCPEEDPLPAANDWTDEQRQANARWHA